MINKPFFTTYAAGGDPPKKIMMKRFMLKALATEVANYQFVCLEKIRSAMLTHETLKKYCPAENYSGNMHFCANIMNSATGGSLEDGLRKMNRLIEKKHLEIKTAVLAGDLPLVYPDANHKVPEYDEIIQLSKEMDAQKKKKDEVGLGVDPKRAQDEAQGWLSNPTNANAELMIVYSKVRTACYS